MPTYTYESLESCEKCGGTFEAVQSIHDIPFTHCPTCNKPCKKIISPFGGMTHGGKLGFDLSKAKESGMQVLKRRDKGVYEKL
jgi:putative FmdB family regulatory protein